MLPRITNALAKFLKPIAEPVVQLSKPQLDTKQEFQQNYPEHQKKEKKENPQEAQRVEDESLATPSESDTPLVASTSVQSDTSQSTATPTSHPLTELLSFFQSQKEKYLQKSGPATYLSNLKNRKKGSKFRKGTILDHKVD